MKWLHVAYLSYLANFTNEQLYNLAFMAENRGAVNQKWSLREIEYICYV